MASEDRCQENLSGDKAIDLNHTKEPACGVYWDRMYQAKGTASTKSLRQQPAGQCSWGQCSCAVKAMEIKRML